MGSSNRDYMQEDYESPRPSWGHDVPTTKWLIIVTLGVFVLQTMLIHRVLPMGHAPSYVEEWFALDANEVLHGQVWRLVSYVFLHSRFDLINLAFNMLALWYLGGALERMYGSREMLWFYLTVGAVCGVIFTSYGLKFALPGALMGSDPCVMALICLYAIHFPTAVFLFCFIIPVQARVLLLIYIAFDVYKILQVYSGQAPWILMAFMSNLWAIGFTHLYHHYRWRLSAIEDMFDFQRLRRTVRRAGTRRTLKVFQPEPASNLDEQVDAILAKIHEQGSESLTERERAILQKASEQAKNRM
jgi:membrane associated rhomboid family serine protease